MRWRVSFAPPVSPSVMARKRVVIPSATDAPAVVTVSSAGSASAIEAELVDDGYIAAPRSRPRTVEPELVDDDGPDVPSAIEAPASAEEEDADEDEAFDVDELLPDDPIQQVLPSRAFTGLMPAFEAVIADPLTMYLAQLRQIEPLPAEEQHELARRYFYDGDVEAARRLIVSNLRLVVKIAKEYRRKQTDFMELIQEGNLGLAEAIQRYDPEKGVKFTSYAQYWVRAMILKYIMNVAQLVKVGNTRAGRRLFYNLRRAREELIREGHTTPTARQLADHLHVSELDVKQVSMVLDQSPVSLDESPPGYESTSLGETIADPNAIGPDALAVAADLQSRIRDAFDTFGAGLNDRRERTIWDRRVTADVPVSLEVLGEEFGVSRERIRQVEYQLKLRFQKFWADTVGELEAQLLFRD